MSDAQEREGLLDAIRATPDDDTPRLVYADWLDDHGEAARAAFIRAQVAGARLTREAAELDQPRPSEAAARLADADKLLRANKKAFLAGLPVGGGFAIYFARGFPENAVARNGKEFVKRAEAAFENAPIRTLTFSEITPGELEKVLATGRLN